jgi:hypothetical protein
MPESSNKCKVSSSLLQAIIKYVGDGIHKIIYLIQEIWDIAQNVANFATIITNFKQYLQNDLENDEGFYKDKMGTFLAKVSSLSSIHRREKKLPLSIHMKQINACWLKRIKNLR